MKVVIQRVTQSSLRIDQKVQASIDKGLVILVGITQEDTIEDIDYLVKKIIQLRIFNDENGVMNLSVNDIKGEVLLVSQFTLYADTKKGNRPSYIQAARPEVAIPLYQHMISALNAGLHTKLQTGVFGADMQISLCNDGPVTIIIDSKNR